ncbi:DUF3943 domain-containing protein [Sulfuricaulis sp.]|jgi:hypothetical protein|uniref:DUF3943 domain-containing protein n=1 Tax=Sulfuricaulis sp. TaxID=2003553 RepID=UPI003559D115
MKTPNAILKALAGKALVGDKSLHGSEFRMVFFCAALALALVTPGAGLAEESEAKKSEFVPDELDLGLPLPLDRHDRYILAQNPAATTSTPPKPSSEELPAIPKKPLRFEETEAGKSYLLPAGEIVGFNILINRLNYYTIDKQVYGTSYRTVRENLSSRWVVDTDPFAVNQFMHPYQGSVYFGLARSTGLDYWESLGYTFGGSLFWEIAGETGLPSINDLVTTGFGGTFLGEPLFRMASLLLEGGGETPGFWQEVGAAAIAPSLGFTRLAFGDRFRSVFDSHDPAVYTYVRFGWNKVDNVFDATMSQDVNRDAATADFHMAYGLPGKAGYTYTRPFDYFDFEFTATTANVFENIMSRGLLVGKEYEGGDTYRGIWGLYGSYDYISPQIFRVSSTALSLGTTAQWWISKTVALQGSALGGLGYGAAGTIHGTGERDYHYGATPQALLALRLMFGDAANLDLTARSYYVSSVASTEDRGSERIFRGDAAFTVRVHGPHAVTLKYNTSQRNAHYPDIADTHQTVTTLSLLYTYSFGETRFGALEWRAAGKP